ncbi:MAG: hypothetical protein ACOY0T_30190 [Myxococcota bacterium]
MPALASRFIALIVLIIPVACGGSGDKDPNVGDPLANADVVRCDMPEDHVCREYQRGKQGNATAFVDLPAARSTCAGGWPGGSSAGGVFSEGLCSQDDTLGRCVTQTHTLPRLVTLDYYYTNFADTATRAEPIEFLKDVCAAVQKNAAAGGVEVTSIFQIPPF